MFKKAHTSGHFSALTTSKIIAHKRSGNVLVYLTQSDSSFFLSFGEIINGKNFRLIAEKTLTVEQVHEVLATVFSTSPSRTSVETPETILLEVSKALHITYAEFTKAVSTESPYFPTKEIFLSHQMTGAPNLA